MSSSSLPSLAYVTHSFPALTETFVYREVFGLRQRGFKVATFAIWRPNLNKLSEEARPLVDQTRYVFPIAWREFLKAQLYFLGTRPHKYLGTLLFAVTRPGESLKNRRRTFLHFFDAVYLAREMQHQGVRHIHAHFAINAATIALVASRLLDISYSFTAHNSFFTDRVILREKAGGARFIAAISEFTRSYLSDLFPADRLDAKIHIVHCGISPDGFAPPDPKLANDVPILLFVAQLVERKGAPVLVEACKLLAERGVCFRCAIIGDGPQRADLQQLVDQYALGKFVELKGVVFQEGLKDYLKRADVFVLPCVIAANGDMDGVPVSLMEAMAMEIPTVSTYVSGIPELIEDGVSGLLVPEKDVSALADALQGLLQDKGLRLKLGKNGRQKIINEFNIDTSVTRLASLFERYVNADRRPTGSA
jgi:glycosyltransferase involved in cell wall biosynthesis